ncbi:uncharacterized protein LOC135829071 [Sycon ciliatum]|uniref:uncharacterized protein LOC135829071 n=1 Tax=Sycon ciliatum TaxID=27933 RepID=UPI0031F6369F
MKNNKHYQYWTTDPNKVLHFGQNSSWYDAVLVDGDATHLYLTACFEEFDECTEGYHDCAENSRCINTDGSYRCECFDDTSLNGNYANRCDGWKRISNYSMSAKVFRGVPLAHDDVWPFCTSFSGGSRVYYYYAFGKYVALSRDKLADTFHLDNDTNSYWVITDQSNLTGCPYMIGRNPVAGGNCGIKRHAVCSRALNWFYDPLKCMPNTYLLKVPYYKDNYESPQLLIHTLEEAKIRCRAFALILPNNRACLRQYMTASQVPGLAWLGNSRAIDSDGREQSPHMATTICEAPLRVLCEFQPARAAAQIVRLFAHPFNEHTWKAADIRCKYQGGNLFNISDYKRTECAKDFLVKLGVMISSPYIWAANDQKMAYSIEKATLLSRVDLDTAHGRSVVCELPLMTTCGDVRFRVVVWNEFYRFTKEHALEQCNGHFFYEPWFQRSTCLHEFLQPVTVHFQDSDFWTNTPNQSIDYQHSTVHLKPVDDSTAERMVLCACK